MVGKSSSEKRTNDGCDTVHGSNETRVDGTLLQRNRVRHDDESAREDTSRTNTGDGSTHDQSLRVGSSSADGTADLEDTNGDQVDPFDGHVGVEFTKHKLEGGRRQEIGGSIPAHVGQGFELICDLGNGGCDNGVVLFSERVSEGGNFVITKTGPTSTSPQSNGQAFAQEDATWQLNCKGVHHNYHCLKDV